MHLLTVDHHTSQGWRVKTCPIPPKTAYFSALKSVEYMTNTLAIIDAQDEGFDQGIFVGPDGFVTEGPNMNIGFVSQEGEVVVAPFDHALAGLTMQRLMEIIPPVRCVPSTVPTLECCHGRDDETLSHTFIFPMIPVISPSAIPTDCVGADELCRITIFHMIHVITKPLRSPDPTCVFV